MVTLGGLLHGLLLVAGRRHSPVDEPAAGQVAEDPVSPSVYEQTKNILKQIDELLAQAKSDKTRLLKTNIWLSDISTFAEMNRAWKEWVPAGQAPARATVEAKLADPKWKVEIMVTAACG